MFFFIIASSFHLFVIAEKFHWSYADVNKTGPAFWGKAYEVFCHSALVLCLNVSSQGCNGKSQSPIDIPSPPDSTPAEISPMTMTKYDKVRQETF